MVIAACAATVRLTQAGLRVPENTPVTDSDVIALAASDRGGLTVIPGSCEMGQLAAKSILDSSAGQAAVHNRSRQAECIARESLCQIEE